MNADNSKLKKIELHFEIISQCLLNCIHCSSDSAYNHDKGFRSTEQIERFLSIIDQDINLYICLTGGEPLLSGNFFSTLEFLIRFNNVKKVGFFSSGSILSENRIHHIDKNLAKKMREYGVNFCYISLYGLQQNHDYVTRITGSYYLTLESIINLQDIGIDVKIHFVPMKSNINSIVPLIRYLDHLGIKEFRFLRLVNHGRAADNWKTIGLSKKEQINILQKALDSLAPQKPGIKITVAGFPEFWDCRPFNIGKKCQAGIRLLYVDYDGTVFPCGCKKKDNNFALFKIGNSVQTLINKKPTTQFLPKCLQDIN